MMQSANSDFIIAKSRLVDAPAIAEISFVHRRAGLIRDIGQVRSMIKSDMHHVLVARSLSSKVVAFGAIRIDEAGMYHVAGLGVHPNHRIPGAASAINNARIQIAINAGAECIRGVVRQSNCDVLPFWIGQGWRVVNEDHEWIGIELALPKA